MKAVAIARICALLLAATGSGHAANMPREVFVGFGEPDAARFWSVAGAGMACGQVAPRPPGQNRFCADRVRFENGGVTLSGEVASLGAVGSNITLRPGPGMDGAKLFPSEGTFAAKIRFRNLNEARDRTASVKAFFTYAVSESAAHFENDFEIVSEANAVSRDMLMPFAASLLDQRAAMSADAVLRATRRGLLPLVTAVTHVAKDGAEHVRGGASPLGSGRAPSAILVVQNHCIEGCGQAGTRVYASTYSMAVQGRAMREIGRTMSTHQPGGYDNLAVMFNLWWVRGGEMRPTARRALARQEMQVLWFYWVRDSSVSAASVAARGDECGTGRATCPFETFDGGAR
ncbi:MAG: hypothetical protein K1X51_12555 [Rhodospirillaceae bacterium]|nr:hypothetical protein [Rhodospirillaceae bacterium]